MDLTCPPGKIYLGIVKSVGVTMFSKASITGSRNILYLGSMLTNVDVSAFLEHRYIIPGFQDLKANGVIMFWKSPFKCGGSNGSTTYYE